MRDGVPHITITWYDCQVGRNVTYPITTAVDLAAELEATRIWVSPPAFPEDLERVRGAGLETVVDEPVLPADEEWAARHPDQVQVRYLVTRPQTAVSGEIVIALLGDFSHIDFSIDTDHDPKRYWLLRDRTTGETVDPERWTYHPTYHQVIYRDAREGHAYDVMFLVYYRCEIRMRAPQIDPFHPEARRRMLERLEREMKLREGSVDVYRCTSLAYHFSNIDWAHWHRPRKRLHDNWYGYCMGVSPLAQERFEAETGIGFSPEWMVDDGNYGHADYVPREEYLEWVRFLRRHTVGFGRKVNEIAGKYVRETHFFWGDQWQGIEPYLGDVEAAGFDGLAFGAKTGAQVRKLMDVPSDAGKHLRFTWFQGPVEDTEKIERQWRSVKRGILMRPPDSLTFGGQCERAVQNPAVKEMMRRQIREFREIKRRIGSEPALRYPITLGILNAWGGMRAWPVKGVVYPSVDIWNCLVALPVRLKFLSFREIAGDAGTLSGVDVLLNCGEPNSAWSGGRLWNMDGVQETVRNFVRRGGGFIGIDAPSFVGEPDGGGFALGDVLGLEYAGPAHEQAAGAIFSPNDANRLETVYKRPEEQRVVLSEDREDLPAWLTGGLADWEGIPQNVVVRPGEGFRVLWRSAGKGAEGSVAGIGGYGEGRTAYLSGVGTGKQYEKLFGRLVYWAARREDILQAVRATAPWVDLYLYEEARLLVAYNLGSTPASCRISCNTGDLGIGLRAEVEEDVELKPGEISYHELPRRWAFWR